MSTLYDVKILDNTMGLIEYFGIDETELEDAVGVEYSSSSVYRLDSDAPLGATQASFSGVDHKVTIRISETYVPA